MSNPVSINTNLTYTNLMDIRAEEIIRLIKLYFPEFSEVYYGHRPIGAQGINFPCAMVEPVTIEPKMLTTGKYHVKFNFQIFFYIQNNERDALAKKQSDLAWGLIKLFSNNALNDMGSGNTNHFKVNNGFWITSEMKEVALSATYAWGNQDQPNFARAGLFSLQLEDVVLI